MSPHSSTRSVRSSHKRKAKYAELRYQLYKELWPELAETTGMKRKEIKRIINALPRKEIRELRDQPELPEAPCAETSLSVDRQQDPESKPWPSLEPIEIDLEAIKFESAPPAESSQVADFWNFAKSHSLYLMPTSPPSSPAYLDYLHDLCEYAVVSGLDKQIRQVLLHQAQRNYGVIHSWLSSTNLDAIRAHQMASNAEISQQKSAEESDPGAEERNKRKRMSSSPQHEEPERPPKAARVDEYVDTSLVDVDSTTKPVEEKSSHPACSDTSSPIHYYSSPDNDPEYDFRVFDDDEVFYGEAPDISTISIPGENATTHARSSEVQVPSSYCGDDSNTQSGEDADDDQPEEIYHPPERFPSVITSSASRRMNWLSPTGSVAAGDSNANANSNSTPNPNPREGQGTIRPGTDENAFPPSSPLGPPRKLHGFSPTDESDTRVSEEAERKRRHIMCEDDPSIPQTPRRRATGLKSTFFARATPSKKRNQAATTTTPPSCIPFPPLSNQSFGLIQEKLADDPFRLLVAVILLNRTRGAVAIPVFYSLVAAFPTIESLATASEASVCEQIQTLGLHNQRASTITRLAHVWLASPPTPLSRTRTLNYPSPGDGRDIGTGGVLSGDDPRVGAFEIAHLPGVGAYALDSWRIFCRDELRGLAMGWNGEGADASFEPEWKRVVPTDKELRAFLRWCWLREGWDWDPLTGEKEVADTALLDRAARGDEAWLQRDGENAGVKVEGVKYRMSDVVQIDDVAAKIAAVWER